MVLAACFTGAARADLTLAYSFETGLEGFAPNGGGTTITQDTIGATDGTQSMKFAIVQGATFVGALTGNLAPQIGDPPGLEVVRFDLTLTEAFPAVGFVQAGITVFGSTQPDYPGGQQNGLQAQFFVNEAPIGDLPVGTHEIEMVLSEATHPLTFQPGSFNDIFGVVGSGQNDIIPTGFQIYINKSTQAGWTGYIDNIRLGTLPPPVDADFNDDTFVDATDLGIWRGAFGATDLGDADGDMDSDGEDFLIWQRQLMVAAGGVAAIPEPSALTLLATVLVAAAMRPRRFATIADK
jgi:hypothetical protein